MKKLKQKLLCFTSNINTYKVIINDGQSCTCIIISGTHQCINYSTNQKYIDIIACPLNNCYTKNICFTLDLSNKDQYDIFLCFTKNEQSQILKYKFKLIDTTYGLPINGILHFNNT